MKSIYTEVAIFENGDFMLRKITKDDAEDLLKVYSDTPSLPFTTSSETQNPISPKAFLLSRAGSMAFVAILSQPNNSKV